MKFLALAVFLGLLVHRALESALWQQANWLFYGGSSSGFEVSGPIPARLLKSIIPIVVYALGGTLLVAIFLLIFRRRGLVRA